MIGPLGEAYDLGWRVMVRALGIARQHEARPRVRLRRGIGHGDPWFGRAGATFPLGMLESRLRCPRVPDPRGAGSVHAVPRWQFAGAEG